MTLHFRTFRCLAFLPIGVLLLSCGQQGAGERTNNPALLASTGQVSNQTGTVVSHYAASRFADQVSFGATPTLVAEIEQKGYAKWIDDQFALPVSKNDPAPIQVYNSEIPAESERVYKYMRGQLLPAFINDKDQLRHRVSWALSQFVVASASKLTPYPALTYANFLQDQAFGNYGDFIRALTTNPSMGTYLDNIQNRPLSNQCIGCSPNENYARELMQLFTIGVVKLNADGSTVRNASGQPVETYTQDDVSQLARALTGWTLNNDGITDRWDHGGFSRVMRMENWSAAHDRGQKTILGTDFPSGREADAELGSIVTLLMSHQNIAPFVSLRLIQHLVTSNPSPAYLARMSAVFRNNGQGVQGDMKALVKAILLDPEARNGDQIGVDRAGFGKVREPILWYTGLLRGLGCTSALNWDGGDNLAYPGAQEPFNASSVFSFFLPTDRAPGSNLLAPEQRLLNADELATRMGGYNIKSASATAAAGCQVNSFGLAFATSSTAYVNLVSDRYFRGAMAPTLRQNLIDLAPTIWGDNTNAKAMNLLAYALSSPYYGVIK
jgi:uncharacterized protein (DUF1800 family)